VDTLQSADEAGASLAANLVGASKIPWDDKLFAQIPEARAITEASEDVQQSAACALIEILCGVRPVAKRTERVLFAGTSYPTIVDSVLNSSSPLGRFARNILQKLRELDARYLVRSINALSRMNSLHYRSQHFLQPLVRCLERFCESQQPDQAFKSALRVLIEADPWVGNAEDQRLRQRVVTLYEALSQNVTELGIERLLRAGEAWSDQALASLKKLDAKLIERWSEMLKHCGAASGGGPNSSWIKTANDAMRAVGPKAFRGAVLDWFPLVDKPRTQPITDWNREWQPDPNQLIIEPHADILKGLAWCCGLREDKELARALTALALSAYRKVPKIGPRLVKVGNACVIALGMMPGMEGVYQLALLKVKVKFGTAQKVIEKALNAAAERVKIPRADLEEMAVPAYGLTDVGVCEEPVGEFTARLTVTTTGTELAWMKADGKVQKGVPAAVKQQFADELKELKAAAKDIERMLPAQKERIDNLFLQQKSWPFAVWRERYLDHPLVGVIARRLLWVFTIDGQPVTGIWFEGRLVDVDLQPLAPSTGTTVELWHPIGRELAEVLGWRAWLDAQRVQQPFKQAHREVYLLTDAERHTRTYSNRFAGHVLKQHQFNALCAARGWKNKLRLMVDAEFPPAAKELPRWGLRAEYWIEGAGEEYGRDTNETGTFLYLTTDQVRFYPIAAGQRTAHAGGGGYHPDHQQTPDEPLPLEQVPPLVLSEILRDVDLFVGVSSVGNDPNWADGGPDGRYAEYWQGYSFGDLGATARTRKEVLERLVPRLKIAKQCAITDKFLVVKGALRTYRIHLGSSNILMEPNDQYLCIVPNQAKADDGSLQLPFEGDRTLSIILSKAFLLAADDKIKDSTILSQIKRA
jgi:hypothetical protein